MELSHLALMDVLHTFSLKHLSTSTQICKLISMKEELRSFTSLKLTEATLYIFPFPIIFFSNLAYVPQKEIIWKRKVKITNFITFTIRRKALDSTYNLPRPSRSGCLCTTCYFTIVLSNSISKRMTR